MACSNYWKSPIHVGDHHLAKCFINAGWEVAFISSPISPLHILKGISLDLKDRFLNYKRGGSIEMEGNLWSYVPGAVIVPQNSFILNNKFLYNNWHKFTCPSLIKKIAQNGFREVDVLYFRDPKHAFLLEEIEHKISIFRVADNDSGFRNYNKEVKKMEDHLIQSSDLVIVTSKKLKLSFEKRNIKRLLYLSNGVNLSHFTNGLKKRPIEFQKIKGPIAIYVGSIDEWFDFDLINEATQKLPHISFVLIGPDNIAKKKLISCPNLFLLGPRKYSDIPSYLYYSDVGIIPFNVKKFPDLVNSINPVKLYEYMACGLPVVSIAWEELELLESPTILCSSAEEFIMKLENTFSNQYDKNISHKYSQANDWSMRFKELEATMQLIELNKKNRHY